MNIAVIFGGKSCEHNISIATGVQIACSLRDSGHNIICIYIDREGKWKTSPSFFSTDVFRGEPGGHRVRIVPGDNRLHYFGKFKKVKIDCAVLCSHGKNGEDGTLQGLLTLSGIPFTGSSVFASAAGMDKEMSKKIFKADKIPVVKWMTADKTDNLGSVIKKAEFTIGYPMIIKPACAGSSIGIGIADNEEKLANALTAAFLWDGKVMIEKALTDFTELNCAVIGDCECVEASEVEKPVSSGEFLSYNDKYHGKGKMSPTRQFPADIDEHLKTKIKQTAKKAFLAIGAEGIARIDFLLDNTTGKLYVNEINTIPGSLALYLFPDKSASELIFLLINLAVKRKAAQDTLKYVYSDSAITGKNAL